MNPFVMDDIPPLRLSTPNTNQFNLPILTSHSFPPTTTDLPNFFLLSKLQNTLQAQMLRNQLSELIKIREQTLLNLGLKASKQTYDSIPPLEPLQPSLNYHLLGETLQGSNSYSKNSPNSYQKNTPKVSLKPITLHPTAAIRSSSQSTVYSEKSINSSPSEAQRYRKREKSRQMETNTSMMSFVDDPNICLEAQIKHMVTFFVNFYGKLTESKVQQERLRYASNQALANVFDTLVVKYAATTKTKEEMVKYILRRAFKSLRKNIKKSTQLDAKGVSHKICKRYFNMSKEDLESQGVEIQDEEELLRLLLPFRKNSKNKTMNSSFITEIFSNEEFKQDYENYLEEFDELAEKDNKEKIKRFTSFIEECIKKESYVEIKKYRRIPWLKTWIESTKKVAYEIAGYKVVDQSSKRVKR